MEGVHDPVLAKALWLQTPESRICLLTTDLVGSLDSLRRDVLKRIPELGLEGNLILAASHNHSGPGALVRGNIFWQLIVGGYDKKFTNGWWNDWRSPSAGRRLLPFPLGFR